MRIKKESKSYTSWFGSQKRFWVKLPMTYLFDDFFTLKPIPASGYCGSLPKFEHEFDRIQIQCVKNLHLRCDKVLNTDCLGLAHIFPSKWFFKSYLKHQSAKHFIAVFTPNYFDKNVGNVRTFKPKDLIAI